MLPKRELLRGAAALAVLPSPPSLSSRAWAEAPPKEIRIGYQKSGGLLIATVQGLFEKAFAPIGASVKWVEFNYGPPLLEAPNAGAIDYGAVGDSPPSLPKRRAQSFSMPPRFRAATIRRE